MDCVLNLSILCFSPLLDDLADSMSMMYFDQTSKFKKYTPMQMCVKLNFSSILYIFKFIYRVFCEVLSVTFSS